MESSYRPVIQDGACLNCTSNREEDPKTVDRQLNASFRKVAFLTAICCVLCVLTISACGCTVYIYLQLQTFRSELVSTVRMQQDAGNTALPTEALKMDASSDYMFSSDTSSQETAGRQRRRKPKKKPTNQANNAKSKTGGNSKGKCKGKCKNVCKCAVKGAVRKIRSMINSGDLTIKPVAAPPPPPTPTPPPPPTTTTTTKTPAIQTQVVTPCPNQTKPRTQFSYVAAAHYTSYVDESYIQKEFGKLDFGDLANAESVNSETDKSDEEDRKSGIVLCKDIPKWNGNLCRNKTFTTSVVPLTLNVFKESNWMSTQPDESKIFDQETDGTFRARHTGIYLLYAHVLFYDAKTRQAFGLLHESGGIETNSFRCMQSVDYQNPDLMIGQNAKYKSCSVNGIIYVQKGDSIKVQNLYPNTRLDLSRDATYFGGMLFANRPFE